MKKYTDFLHNQNRFSLMKKITVFLLFCFAILRGPQVSAQTCDSVRFTINLSTCGVATLSYVNSGSIAYTFSLDNVVSATNTWQNITQGNHILTYAGSNGCVSVRNNVWLYPNIGITLEQQPLRTCADTIYSFKIKVLGGQAPFTFKVDNGQQTTDSIAFLREGGHYISLIDGLGCRIDSMYIYAWYGLDSASAITTFAPNSTCDTLGTLKIAVNNPRIQRPFTISLNGSPFTSDTVFRNTLGLPMPFIVKSAQGCLYQGYVRSYYLPLPQLQLSGSFDSPCANRLGRGAITAYASSSNVASFSYLWSNGNTTKTITDVPIGTYSLTVTNNTDGCTVVGSTTLTTCVWAGDTDTSGVVNAADLLNIGLAFSEIGAARPYCSQDTANRRCTAWGPNDFSFWSKQTATGVNFKHIDADGNGIINHKDTLAITANWQKTRNVRGNGNPLEVRGAAPPIFVQTGRVVEGQWASFPIMLGDVANAANGIYGLAFSINYDASVIDASTVYLTYNQNWLGSGDNVVRISKNFNGSIEAAVSRINQQNASGNGQIATLNFKMKAGTMGRNLAFSIDNQQVINKDAQVIPVVPTPTSTTVLTGTAEPDWARQIEVFPNPTTGNVNIEGQNLDIKSVEVFDISGKSLFKSENIGKGGPLSIEHAGTYFLKISTEKGVIMRKVVRL
jgi:hypothetical protein